MTMLPEKKFAPEESLLRAIWGPISQNAHTVCRNCEQLCIGDEHLIASADLAEGQFNYYKCPECGHVNELAIGPKEEE